MPLRGVGLEITPDRLGLESSGLRPRPRRVADPVFLVSADAAPLPASADYQSPSCRAPQTVDRGQTENARHSESRDREPEAGYPVVPDLWRADVSPREMPGLPGVAVPREVAKAGDLPVRV